MTASKTDNAAVGPSFADTAGEGGLHLRLHRCTVLVPLDTVRAVLGLDAEGVVERVEAGQLRWVWDISARARGRRPCSRLNVRELRFWASELIAPGPCRALPPEQVIGLILGAQRQCWRAGEVVQRLLCSRSIVKRLVDAGELSGPLEHRLRWITRQSLADFLRRRLVE
jgi:hypothetical protein